MDSNGNSYSLGSFQSMVVMGDQRVNIKTQYSQGSSEVTITNINIINNFGNVISRTGALQAIDTVAGTITTDGGMVFGVPVSVPILDADGKNITLAQLAELYQTNIIEGVPSIIDTIVACSRNGTVSIAMSISLRSASFTKKFTLPVDSIDTAQSTITIEGQSYGMADGWSGTGVDGAPITDFNSLAGMASILNRIAIPISMQTELIKVGAVWKVRAIKLLTKLDNSSTIISESRAQYANGMISVDTALGTVSIGGMAITPLAGCTITDGSGNSIKAGSGQTALEKLAAIIADNDRRGIPTYARISLSGNAGALGAVSIDINTGVSDTVKARLSDVSVAGNTITVGSETGIDISGAAIKKTDGTILTAQDLKDLISNNPDYLVGNMTSNNITVNGVTYSYNSSAVMVKDPDGKTITALDLLQAYQVYGTMGKQLYVKITATGSTASMIEVKQMRSVMAEMTGYKDHGAWKAASITVDPKTPAENNTANYFSSTTPIATIGGINVTLDSNTTVTDKTNLLAPSAMDLAALAERLADSSSGSIPAQVVMEQNKNAANADNSYTQGPEK
jgi:hypothetical protein